ncbi:MAG TPA: adenylyl-sulfate kinase, partial [Alphaproteobacteria bacterium]|nr:adenylyl-sulfate kinase [Alphaproteobacteria bacterium]
EQDFIEIFVDTPLEIAEARDPKGLYKKARAGLIPNFTGIGSAYETPADPDLHLHSDQKSVDDLVLEIEAFMDAKRS